MTPGVSPRHIRASTELQRWSCPLTHFLHHALIAVLFQHSLLKNPLLASRGSADASMEHRSSGGSTSWRQLCQHAAAFSCCYLTGQPAHVPVPIPAHVHVPVPTQGAWGRHTTMLFPLPRSVPQASKHHVLLHPLVQAFLQGAQRGLSAQHVARHLLGTAVGHGDNAVP